MCAVEVLSLIDAMTGDPTPARHRAAAELQRSLQETVRLGYGALIHALAVAALAAADDLATARNWATKLYAQEQQGAGYLAWHAQDVLMRAAAAEGDAGTVRSHSQMLSDVAQRLGNRRALAVAWTGLARAVTLEGDLTKAESLAHDALQVLNEHHWPIDAIAALDIIAAVAALTGRPELAARLFAAGDRQRERLGVVRIPRETATWEAHLAAARDALGPEQFAAAVEQGRSLSLDQAVAYARRGRGRHHIGVAGLSPVEEQVARLAASGLNNIQIAQALFISRSTVKVHLSHIYTKLGVANRTELARASSAWPQPA
jgi:DNA-binding CsgD family transcriptional regulator